MERPVRVWMIGKSAWLLDEKSALANHRGQPPARCAIDDAARRAGTATRTAGRVDPLERQRNAQRLRDLEPLDPRD